MKLVGANPAPTLVGLDELPGKSNYFVGGDPSKWRVDVSHYAKVCNRDVYPGVDLVYYGNYGQLEYDFVVAPGADPKSITMEFQGIDQLRVDGQGDLILRIAGGEIRQREPFVYHETDGVKQAVAGRYVLKGKHQVGFEVTDHDKDKALVIDPVLSYSTYLGGDSEDFSEGIAVDFSGNVYLTGDTFSSDFPLGNAVQTRAGGGGDAFVTKLNASGSALIYSTYLGGSGADFALSVAVDSFGNAYVSGQTDSSDFPTRNPLQAIFGGGKYDAFVTKLSPTGAALLYSTYLGGSGEDTGRGIAVDSSGNAYVMGGTGSLNFPIANAFQPTKRGGKDAFVTKLNSAGSALIYSTFLGGSGDENQLAPDFVVGAIAVDSSGNACVAGSTSSTDFPTMNSFQSTSRGGRDAFVTKLNSTGSALVYSTYLGGSGDDSGHGVAVDSTGNAYVTGNTNSTNFPTVNAFQPTNGGTDAFVTKLNPGGSALVFSTYLGGGSDDTGWSIAVDSSGNAYVAGETYSVDFPVANALQTTKSGGSDVFVTKFSSAGSSLVYSTFLGGGSGDVGFVIAVDSSGGAHVTGWTESTDFLTKNPFQATFRGGRYEAFVAKIAEPGTATPPSFQITMSKSSYVDGDTVTVTEFRPRNPDSSPTRVKLRIWLKVPTVGEITLIDLGSDGSFQLPANLDVNVGPLSLFTVTSTFPPKGNWEFNSRLTNPATGALLSEDINPFEIK